MISFDDIHNSTLNLINKIRHIHRQNIDKQKLNNNGSVTDQNMMNNDKTENNSLTTHIPGERCDKILFDYKRKVNDIRLYLKNKKIYQSEKAKINEKLFILNNVMMEVEWKILKRFVNISVDNNGNANVYPGYQLYTQCLPSDKHPSKDNGDTVQGFACTSDICSDLTIKPCAKNLFGQDIFTCNFNNILLNDIGLEYGTIDNQELILHCLSSNEDDISNGDIPNEFDLEWLLDAGECAVGNNVQGYAARHSTSGVLQSIASHTPYTPLSISNTRYLKVIQAGSIEKIITAINGTGNTQGCEWISNAYIIYDDKG